MLDFVLHGPRLELVQGVPHPLHLLLMCAIGRSICHEGLVRTLDAHPERLTQVAQGLLHELPLGDAMPRKRLGDAAPVPVVHPHRARPGVDRSGVRFRLRSRPQQRMATPALELVLRVGCREMREIETPADVRGHQ
jgi:hypothetical protein